MPVRLSYINARGNEIILDDDEHSFLGELAGREGFEAPAVSLTNVKYGNGSEEVISAALKSRELTCYFWVETQNRAKFERRFNELKSELIQVGKKSGNWGQLRVRRSDGSYVYINCIYSEGLNDAIYDSPVRKNFSLTFMASDPYFYDSYDTVQEIRIFEEGAYLHFGTVFHFGSGTHFRSSDTLHTELVWLNSHMAYPEITITGPARNLLLRNVGTGKVIEFDPEFELLADESVVIRTMPLERSAVWHRYDGTERNALRYLTPDSALDWYLEAGENELQYRNSDNNQISVCTLKYRQGWLSAN